MGKDKFIWCRHCDEVHHVSPFDRAPTYALIAGEAREMPADDWRDFMERHAGHKLEPLRGIGERYLPREASLDPMSIGYLEVTNGHETFLLRRSRASIEEPLRYQLIRGRMVNAGTTIEVQENAIRKEMKFHFSWEPAESLNDQKIDLFIELYKEVVRALTPSEIRISEDSYSDPAVSYGFVDSKVLAQLMTKCAASFLPLEMEGLRRFVDSHREGSDVMTLVLKPHYAIEESTGQQTF